MFSCHYLILFLSSLYLYLIKTNGYLTNHEADELFGHIKELQIKNDICNNKLNNLILRIIKNKTDIKIFEYLTPSPNFDN